MKQIIYYWTEYTPYLMVFAAYAILVLLMYLYLTKYKKIQQQLNSQKFTIDELNYLLIMTEKDFVKVGKSNNEKANKIVEVREKLWAMREDLKLKKLII